MSAIEELTGRIKAEKGKKLTQILTDEEILKPNGLADEIAKELRSNLKSTQLRKVFDKIKEIENALNRGEDYRSKILELYPKLAYSTGRKLMPRKFFNLFTLLLEKAERDREDAKMVVKLITAIVAYSKLHGDRG
ncbi:type III-A CRISPR-associated protein Csm2 [Desulfurobacterium sp.]|uniref:type III-A CRISPR-associated protein Csm2 n=1 Tax=Desulfurobacterium sp. TaxID=2004706 RepID=UPI0026106789|nr:type III-A CRISPR-associated protein Csm2 [Desulfurobacterium sp.]